MSANIALNAIGRLDMQPALVCSFAVNNLAAAIQELARAEPVSMLEQEAASRIELASAYGYRAGADDKPFVFVEGIAIIPVHGMLINRFGRSWGYVTGYNFIRAQSEAADADEDVIGIIYDVNSYGGEVAGCFELCADIAKVTKPTLAVVDSAAYSAGYAVTSACKKIVVTPSGGVGSVGVISTHWSYEKMLDAAGVKVTLIYSGERKADGNPFQDLPENVRDRMKKNCDTRRLEFATLVASNRGLDVQAVMATEADSFRPDEAITLGLIDAVATPAQAVSAFFNELSGSTTEEEDEMSTQANKAPGAESQKAETAPGTQPAVTAAPDATQARKDERVRISAIMGCDEAKDKQKLASHLALSTEMSAEDAKAILATAAAETQAAQETPAAPKQDANSFTQAMNNTANPAVGSDSAAGKSDNGELSMAEQIIRDQKLATGAKLN